VVPKKATDLGVDQQLWHTHLHSVLNRVLGLGKTMYSIMSNNCESLYLTKIGCVLELET
jgi:hypothetical protein